jgi:hypothetical protein
MVLDNEPQLKGRLTAGPKISTMRSLAGVQRALWTKSAFRSTALCGPGISIKSS